MIQKRRFKEAVDLSLLCLLLVPWSGRLFAAPVVLLTNVPAYGSFDNLGGIVLEATPAACRVAVFIYVGGAWWSKPTCPGQPLTVIQPDGSWTADVTTGGSDQLATRFAALLVSTNYSQPCVLGSQFLPTNVFAEALASAVVTRPSPGVRWLSFSGYDWWLKSSTGPVGPGPNYFSDSTNNVWLDAASQLHVRITNRSNQWQCAELVSAHTFGYGNYRFELGSPVDNLNLNAVLGLFTWSDDPAYTDREIDIECSRWANAADTNNAQYVVQPYNLSQHLVRYRVPPDVADSTHAFAWQTNRVSYQSQVGPYTPNPVQSNIISAWVYTNSTPLTGDENVRINLWLFNGSPPTDSKEVEFVLRSFAFVPLGTPPPAQLAGIADPVGGPPRFNLTQCQPDWHYQVLASSNLTTWQPVTTLLATNRTMEFRDTNGASSGRRFYRVVTLP